MVSVLPMSQNVMPTPDNVVAMGGGAPRKRSNTDLFYKLTNEFRRDSQASEKWRRKCDEWYAMRAGKQWDDQTLSKLRAEDRPALTFNRIGSIINVISGVEVSNRQEVKVFGRSEGDAQVSEQATQGIKWFDDRAQAAYEESHAFRDMAICGVGCTETRVNYLDDQEGKGERDRVYPKDMFWDADARKRNLTDARRIFRIKVMELSEAVEEYPDFDPEDLDADWTGLAPNNLTEVVDERVRDYRRDNHRAENDMTRPVRIVQAQWWEKRQQFFVYVESEQRDYPISASDVATYRGIDGYRVRKVPMKVWFYAIIGSKVLDWGELTPQGQFHFQFMTGEFNESDQYWQGIVEPMMDPQKWQNKLVSSVIHILASQSKGGIMFESDAFVNKQKALRDWAQPNAQIEVTAGTLSGTTQNRGPKILEKPTGQLPQGIDEVLNFSRTSIYECSGVPFELLAQDVSDQLSGVQEYERTRRGINVLAPLFDSLKLYRIQQASLTLDFLREFFEGQLMRVASQGKQQYVRLAFEPGVEAYDMSIDDAPTAPNMKERTWQLLLPLLPIMVQLEAPADMWAAVLEYSPLPADLVQKIIGAQDEEKTPEEEAAFQMQMRQWVAEIMKTESESHENLAQAEHQLASAMHKRTQAAEVAPRLKLDQLSELHEMDVSRQVPPSRKQVVDIQ